MPVFALITWIVTALGGLYLLAIWLIEYDPDFQRATATRLPVPVISSHVLLALGGLIVWIMYLITDDDKFAWATIVVLACVASFGMTMAVRWIGVYRSNPLGTPAPALAGQGGVADGRRDAWTPKPAPGTGGSGLPAPPRPAQLAVPPERHFPVSVVIAHGVFATATIVLVLLTTLGIGVS
jgi:hypothetical protein